MNASAASAVTVTTPGWPSTTATSAASLAVVARRAASGSNRQIWSKAPGRPASTARTKAGIRTPPPPRMASFIALFP